ncbi:MAG: TonB-dependent receptor plug domain-containing protein [Muribaculaceae bacterium]
MAKQIELSEITKTCLAICLSLLFSSLSAQNKTTDDENDEHTLRLEEVVVTANAVERVKKTAYNVVALSTENLSNTTKSLSDALAKTPGLKLRESGGIGSDMSMTLDGFSGKHIKIFIDGVPQEGVGEAFSLNNIPVNYAERIEVYKGVVPVGFGTDALGGVINIVTGKQRKGWSLDASYTYGSFNTHKSYVDYTFTSDKGLAFEINAFQNYSDNNYWVDTPVEVFNADGTTVLDTSKLLHVRRFNDTYHNETVLGKIGVVNKKWADRLMFGMGYSHMYKEIQTGVVQKVVFGQKHRHGYSVMPSLEYQKRNFLTKGLSVTVTANYNRNITQNVDTASCRYNWLGESKYQNGTLGEQSYQDNRLTANNWNTAITLKYWVGSTGNLVFNHVFNSFTRDNTPTAGTSTSQADAFSKTTRKNISGLSYTFLPNETYNVSAFAKYYHQYNSGPVSTSASGSTDYILLTNVTSSMGYGLAGTYHFLRRLQAKLSYERAFRLPTNEELFGDEDLELGSIGLKPERSDNLNFCLSHNGRWDKHYLYAEGTLIYRDTKDYIQRRIGTYTGNKTYATYQNHGKVRTTGYTLSLRYNYGEWLSVGGTFTDLSVRDNVKTLNEGSAQANLTYKDRIPNQPYLFANSDISLFWKNCGGKGKTLTVTYDNYYQHSFPLYSESLGLKESKEMVPSQFSHNVGISYSMNNGMYNVAVECQNLTDEKLYDNFSLQKPGRAFYAKLRVVLGSQTPKGHRRATSGRNKHK